MKAGAVGAASVVLSASTLVRSRHPSAVHDRGNHEQSSGNRVLAAVGFRRAAAGAGAGRRKRSN
ncbi:MAG: hypothetical protein JSW71_22810 [Gemmatimonadota bacterium]|nr:MAG: hypothetical protein JSW71_22810 [Gemmatimonadota bacterium]